MQKENCKGINNADMEIKTFDDVLTFLFSNMVAKHPEGSLRVEISLIDDDESECETYESIREEFFEMMLEDEINAFDALDEFVNSPKAGLPEPDIDNPLGPSDSLDARIEHAEWNNDAFRERIIHTLAAFESSVAYYATLKIEGANEDDIWDLFAEVEDNIRAIVDLDRELELLIGIIKAEYDADFYEAKFMDATERCEILTNILLENYNDEFSNEVFEEDDESDEEETPEEDTSSGRDDDGCCSVNEDDEDDFSDDCEGE